MEKITIAKLNSSVFIGSNIASNILQDILKKYHLQTSFVVSDANVYQLYRSWLVQFFPAQNIFCVPAGEKTKSFVYLQKIYDFLLKQKAHRNSLLVAFGGGVIGDLVGFAAASFMRGIALVQVPTTLLAQVDSSIGGKTAINHPTAKNTIGAFYQPCCSIIDTCFLDTLAPREFLSGYAEILKYSLIQDANLFTALEQIKNINSLQKNSKFIADLISLSCKIKLAVVEADEKEKGLRAILNFGHTLAHWIEAHTEYKQYLHGEAVLAGMDFALWWSQKHLMLKEQDYQRARQHLLYLAPQIVLKNVEKANFCSILAKDKKNYNKGLNFIGINKIGQATIDSQVSIADLWQEFLIYTKITDAVIAIK